MEKPEQKRAILQAVQICFTFEDHVYNLFIPFSLVPHIPFLSAKLKFYTEAERKELLSVLGPETKGKRLEIKLVVNIQVSCPYFHLDALNILFAVYVRHKRVSDIMAQRLPICEADLPLMPALPPQHCLEMVYWNNYFGGVVETLSVFLPGDPTPFVDETNYQFLFVLPFDVQKYIITEYIKIVWKNNNNFGPRMSAYVERNGYIAEVFWKYLPQFEKIILDRLKVPTKRMSGLLKCKSCEDILSYLNNVKERRVQMTEYDCLPDDIKTEILKQEKVIKNLRRYPLDSFMEDRIRLENQKLDDMWRKAQSKSSKLQSIRSTKALDWKILVPPKYFAK